MEKQKICIHIRWMIRRDMDEVLGIDYRCFPQPWHEEDFIKFLRQRNNIGMVADYADKVVGWMVYSLNKTNLDLARLAVHPGYQRRNIGSALIHKLKSKLHNHRQKLITTVRETNLPAQHFYSHNDLLAKKVLRNHYDEEDGYLFQFVKSETSFLVE